MNLNLYYKFVNMTSGSTVSKSVSVSVVVSVLSVLFNNGTLRMNIFSDD